MQITFFKCISNVFSKDHQIILPNCVFFFFCFNWQINILRSLFQASVSHNSGFFISMKLPSRGQREKPGNLLTKFCNFPRPRSKIKCFSLLPKLRFSSVLLLQTATVSLLFIRYSVGVKLFKVGLRNVRKSAISYICMKSTDRPNFMDIFLNLFRETNTINKYFLQAKMLKL